MGNKTNTFLVRVKFDTTILKSMLAILNKVEDSPRLSNSTSKNVHWEKIMDIHRDMHTHTHIYFQLFPSGK